MLIKVGGEEIEVAVSDSGMFYDTKTKVHYAKTLAGLKKKIAAARQGPVGTIVVRSSDGAKKGLVLGRAGGPGYNKNYFRIQWEDHTSSVEWGGLLKDMTEEELAQLNKLSKIAYDLSDKCRIATSATEKFRNKHNTMAYLESAFPKV